jgi:GNAT superfamily N-acetyltransferase
MQPQTGAAIRIRAATAEDCTALATLAAQLGDESSVQQIERRLAGLQQSDENQVFLAEAADGTVAGWIGVFVYRSLSSDARVEISTLIVDEKQRSKGVGAALVKRAEQWAIEKGCRVVGVHTNVIRERAHAFYERNGYALVKTQKFFRKEIPVDAAAAEDGA